MRSKIPTPGPKIVKATCSECDQPWEFHSPDSGSPTLVDCVRVLRAELTKAKGRRSGSVG